LSPICFDNGVGIEDNRKDVIFHRAFQYGNNVRGMGLGLSLVNNIIKTYRGQIWVEDRVKGDYSKGSNFIILIPEV
jgi:signal transduction histidine kinase